MNDEEIKNEFINCIEGTHTLNLAISVLEDREEYKKEIERLNNIIKEVRKILESKKHCERLLGGVEGKTFTEQALEILDKVSDEE